jgi:predicted nucleic acid-binding protein
VLILDTNIVSELAKRLPDSTVQFRYERAVEVGDVAISVVTLFELRFGAARALRPATLWTRIQARILCQCKVLPLVESNALAAADLFSGIAGGGRSMSVQDILIAGTAWAAGATLVTRNTRHFDHIPGLKIENWFLPPQSPLAA